MSLKKDSLKIVFIGPPGSGKAAQATFIRQEYGRVCHLTTGDMLQTAIKSPTMEAEEVKKFFKRKEQIPDYLMIKIIRDAILRRECTDGFILDGFPRTYDGALMLDVMLESRGQQLDHVFQFHMEDKELMRRVTGRRIHPGSGRVYHIESRPPKVPWKDDVTGEPLVHLKEEHEEEFATRLNKYHEEVKGALQYYKGSEIFTVIDASKPEQSIYRDIKSFLKKQPNPVPLGQPPQGYDYQKRTRLTV